MTDAFEGGWSRFAAAPATAETGIAAIPEVIGRSSMANAFEGMRTSFSAAIAGGGGHLRTAASKVAAGVGTICETLAVSGRSRRWIMSAEILSDRRRSRRTPILLAQGCFPIGHASTVDRVVCPDSGSGILIIEVVDGHHIDPSMRPVERAKEETGSHRDARSPYIPDT